jgi:hypothetical protein
MDENLTAIETVPISLYMEKQLNDLIVKLYTLYTCSRFSRIFHI